MLGRPLSDFGPKNGPLKFPKIVEIRENWIWDHEILTGYQGKSRFVESGKSTMKFVNPELLEN